MPNNEQPIPRLNTIADLPSDQLQADSAVSIEEKLFGDPKRREESKQAIHQGFIWFLRVAVFCFIAVFIVRIIHFVLPAAHGWLSESQLQAIDKLFFSGTLGALVMQHLRKVIPDA